MDKLRRSVLGIRIRRVIGVLAALLTLGATFAVPAQATQNAHSTALRVALVRLRVEGANATLFEGFVLTFPHSVTTASGGTHHCDGTNNGANPSPGPTAIGALDNAAGLHGFTFDGAYFPAFDDYLVDTIAGESASAITFWDLLRNGTETSVGGCQQRIHTGDDIVFAISGGGEPVLKLSGPAIAAVGVPATYRVVDEATGAPIAGATVGGGTTAADGTVSLTFGHSGVVRLKAEHAGDIRSNSVRTITLP